MVFGVLRIQRTKIRQFTWSNEYAAGMHTDVAGHAFELLGKRQELANFIFVTLALSQLLFFFFGHLDGDELTGLERHELCNTIDKTIALLQDAAHIPNSRFGCHGAKGCNLTHGIFTVFVFDVLNHAVAPVLAKIDIKVGHRYPLWI